MQHLESDSPSLGPTGKKVDTADDMCCLGCRIEFHLPFVEEIRPHYVALEQLRGLQPGDVCLSHTSSLIKQTWHHARRVLQIYRDVGSSRGIDRSFPQMPYAVLLAMEVWTMCAPIDDIMNRSSQWHKLAYGVGLPALDRLRDLEPEAQARFESVIKRLSAYWSAARVSPQPPGKKAVFIDPAQWTSASGWGFLVGTEKATCFNHAFPHHKVRTQEEVILLNVDG